MKALLLVLVLAANTPCTAFATDLLAPGIYRLAPAVQAAPGDDARPVAKYERNVERIESAIPEAAKVRYAMVSRDEKLNLNKLVFLAEKGYQRDLNSANKLCIAYAFPNWNYQSESQPYCRTNIGGSDYEALLTAENQSFSVRWQAKKMLERQDNVPPQRSPNAKDVGACAALGVCDEEAYGDTISHYVTTHYVDRFSLYVAKPYMDILYLNKAMPAYTRSDRSSSRTDLDAGNFVAVTAIYPEWYEIEWVGQDGSTRQCWLDRDDLIDGEWVDQTAETKNYLFRVAVKTTEQFRSDSSSQATAIEILDRKTKERLQIIHGLDSDLQSGRPEALLSVVDANFDGHPDISIFRLSGGAGPNSTENFFLFNPRTRQFEFSEVLSDLPQIGIHPANRTISSAQRDGCCSHSSETYRYLAGKLSLIADWNEQLSADGKWLETTTGKLVGGKMLRRTTKTRVPKNW